MSLLLAEWPLHRDFLVKKQISAVKTDKVYSYKLIFQYPQYLTTKHTTLLSVSHDTYWEFSGQHCQHHGLDTHTRSICFLLKLILLINSHTSRAVLCTFEKVSMDLWSCLPLHLWEWLWYLGLISRGCSLSWAWQHYLIVGSWPFPRLSMQIKKKKNKKPALLFTSL